MRQTVVHNATLEEVGEIVERMFVSHIQPLQEEVAHLQYERKVLRRVISAKEAAQLFDGDVTEATIKDYIRYWGLPAFKRGMKWFVYRDDLEDFQIGKIGFPDKSPTVNIVSPKHTLRRVA